MNTRSLALLLPIVTCLMLALTSCGFLSLKSSPPDGCPATGPGMCVTLETIGDTTMKGTIFVPRPGNDPEASCATWVRGGGDITLPGAFDQVVGGRKVRFGGRIVGYTGPGSYQGDDAIRSGNNPLTVTVSSRGYSASRGLLGRVTAEVRADGSGTVTFVNLVETVKRKKKDRAQINGRYTWTCRD